MPCDGNGLGLLASPGVQTLDQEPVLRGAVETNAAAAEGGNQQ